MSVPYLHFDRLVFDINNFGGKLDSNGRFALQIELVFSKSRYDVRFAYSRISHQNYLQLSLWFLFLPWHQLYSIILEWSYWIWNHSFGKLVKYGDTNAEAYTIEENRSFSEKEEGADSTN